jgi:hypothetical protein
MSFDKSAMTGIIAYLAVYFIALALLTVEVFSLYGAIDATFIETLLSNLATTDPIRYWLIVAIVPCFFLWMFYVAFSQAPPEAKRQSFMCVIVLIIFLVIAFYAILALVYMAVVFVGVYMSGVGSGLGGYDDGKKEGGVMKYIPLVGVILGLFIEFSLSGLLDFISPVLSSLELPIPLPSQDVSPNPSGYGIGYYITIVSIIYSLLKTLRRSLGLRSDILGSDTGGDNASALSLVLNPLFVIFWVLATVLLWPLLPFVFLNLGLALLYIMGWITGYKGLTG